MNFDIQLAISKLEDYVIELGSHNPFEIMLILFTDGAWILFLFVFIWGMWLVYLNYIQGKYAASIKWTLLAIDIPQENLQPIKAVEHIFAAMWPFLESNTLAEKYIEGKFQKAFSLEIVSIGGYTQFIIRVPVTHKDIVEAAVYAQYPKAEIAEVEDYTLRYKDIRFPSDEYDLWGSEFKLTKPSPYPIRTYPSFEDSLTQSFADPMASLLEVFNSINRDEELWMQFVITPIKDDWKEEGYKIINKIIGVVQPRKKSILDHILFPFYYMLTLAQELFTYGIGYDPGQLSGPGTKENEINGPPNKILYLTPEEKNVIEGITVKISKLGYRVKMRAIYIGKFGKLNKAKGVAAFIGALQQFSTLDMNAFAPIMKTFTKAVYMFVKRRIAAKQNRILNNFRYRSQHNGWGSGFILNIEELASVFHFPVPEAVRESLKRVDAKKEAAPIELPDTIYEEAELLKNMGKENGEDFPNMGDLVEGGTKGEPPTDLPI